MIRTPLLRLILTILFLICAMSNAKKEETSQLDDSERDVQEDEISERSFSSHSSDDGSIIDELTRQLDEMMEDQWREVEEELQDQIDRELEESLRQMDDEIDRAIRKQIDDQLDKQLAQQMEAYNDEISSGIQRDLDEYFYEEMKRQQYLEEENGEEEYNPERIRRSPVTVEMLNEQIKKIVDRYKAEQAFGKQEL